MFRQGDILVRRINKLPMGLREKDNTVALGEVTGHSHKIMNGKVMVDNSGNQFVIAQQGTKLVHEEHEQIPLEEGNYEIVRQREYNPIQNRQVTD